MNKLNRLPRIYQMIVILLITSGGLLLDTVLNLNTTRIHAENIVATKSFNDKDYNEVLKTYVSEARVDYKSLQKNRQKLDRFNTMVGNLNPTIYQGWSESEKIAFLINAYNSFTLESIIDQNPLKKSIRDISGVWKRRKFKIAGELKTLDNIEHQTLRANFNEPRIHMALVCAAKSCPPLRKETYRGEKLDAQLDDQTRSFLSTTNGFRIDYQKNRVYLSSIFKWFGKDWLKTYGIDDKFTGNAKQRAVLNFISQYLNDQDRDYLVRGNYKLSYLPYDWSLNKQ